MLLRVVPFDAKEGIGEIKNILGEGVLEPSTLQAREKKPFTMYKGITNMKKNVFDFRDEASKVPRRIQIIG